MRIAIPTTNGRLCSHFGHCRQFTFIDVNPDTKEIIKTEELTPPPHEPGVLPRWLGQQGCQVVLAGGIGEGAVSRLSRSGIRVIIGVRPGKPGTIATDFINDRLQIDNNTCDSKTRNGRGGGCQSHH